MRTPGNSSRDPRNAAIVGARPSHCHRHGSCRTFLIIGHRGAAGLEPENTLRSFARALDIGVDAIELDVYCVDEQIVVIHDDTLERTTNGRGDVMATSYDALRRLDAGKGERIPTLDEVLELVAGTGDRQYRAERQRHRRAGRPGIVAAHPNVDTLVSSFEHANSSVSAGRAEGEGRAAVSRDIAADVRNRERAATRGRSICR